MGRRKPDLERRPPACVEKLDATLAPARVPGQEPPAQIAVVDASALQGRGLGTGLLLALQYQFLEQHSEALLADIEELTEVFVIPALMKARQQQRGT